MPTPVEFNPHEEGSAGVSIISITLSAPALKIPNLKIEHLLSEALSEKFSE